MSKYFKNINKINFFDRKFTIARSILAFGTLVTILFNDINMLFIPNNMSSPVYDTNMFSKLSMFYILGLNNLVIAKIICIISLSLVILGFLPRYMSIIHWWVTFSMFNGCLLLDGGDQISVILSFFLIPVSLPDNRVLSWKKNLSKVSTSFYLNIIAYYGLLSICIQMSFVYFQACISKFFVPEWINGTALYYWLTNNLFGVSDGLFFLVKPIIYNPILLPISTWLVLILEFALALALINKKNRSLLLKIGIFFHFLIFLFHGLFSFFLAMTAGLIIYLSNFKTNKEWTQSTN